MDFSANKTPIEIKQLIKEGAFCGTYFRDIYSGGTKSHGNNLISWKILIKSIIALVITMLVLINMVLNVEHR